VVEESAGDIHRVGFCRQSLKRGRFETRDLGVFPIPKAKSQLCVLARQPSRVVIALPTGSPRSFVGSETEVRQCPRNVLHSASSSMKEGGV
jgi:hypothetical protein